jgi:hypothetical protein
VVDHARLGCPPLTCGAARPDADRSGSGFQDDRARSPGHLGAQRQCRRDLAVDPRVRVAFPPIWSPVVNQQEHFPLVAALDWLWAAVATGNVLMTGRASDPDDRTRSGAGSFVFSMTAVWATTAVASIFAPPLVTGTDPTRIPLVAMLVPLAAMAVTGFICLHAATARARRS